MGQATGLFFVALIACCKQLFVCLTFMGQSNFKDFPPMKIVSIYSTLQTSKAYKLEKHSKHSLMSNLPRPWMILLQCQVFQMIFLFKNHD